MSGCYNSKVFIFRSDAGKSLEIKIPEILDPSYGMYVWPSAPVLALYLWKNQLKVMKKNVLELGAGTALPGVLAAKIGAAKVTLSDASHLPQCLENSIKSCTANALQSSPVVDFVGITWGQFTTQMTQMGPLDILLGSDCFYDTKDFEDVIVTVAYLLQKNPRAEFWTTYQERSADRSIAHLLEKWGLQCIDVPLEHFEAEGSSLAGSDLPGDHVIRMMVITLKDEDTGG